VISFGTPQTTASGTSLFGTKPLFGSPATTGATTTSLFGESRRGKYRNFRDSGQQTTGVPGGTSLFGQSTVPQQPKPLFGAATTPAFGAATPATGTSLFGQQAQAQQGATSSAMSIFSSSGFAGWKQAWVGFQFGMDLVERDSNLGWKSLFAKEPPSRKFQYPNITSNSTVTIGEEFEIQTEVCKTSLFN
jgi:hypothetical protein